MSQVFQCKDNVGFSLGGEGDNGVMIYVEATVINGKWKAIFYQTSDVTIVDGEYDSGQEATLFALKVVVRDLEETLREARKKLKKAQRRKVKP